MQERFAWLPLVILLTGGTALGGEPAPASRQAFMALPTTYVSIEITYKGAREFGAPKDALTDRSYRVDQSVRFELPFNMQLPDSCPSGVPPDEAMEQGRCMGWSAIPPDDPAMVEQMISGKLDMSKNPMFSPAEFSIDDVSRYRFRDTPSQGWGTQTRTSKGSGIAYVGRSGMLLCDFKKLACDLSGVSLGFHGGTDVVEITTTSDVPGFEPKKETMAPGNLLPPIPQEVASKLMGFPITIPGPSTVIFSGPVEAAGDFAGTQVVLKLTLSSRPAAGAARPSK